LTSIRTYNYNQPMAIAATKIHFSSSKIISNKIILLFILCWVEQGFTQVNFEKGYFINTIGEQTKCLIKNVDWKNSPNQFEYKLNENEPVQVGSIALVQEFGVPNKFVYKRATVNIDRSSNQISLLSKIKDPVYTEETLFLKLLVSGEANLYLYEDGNLRRFFFDYQGSSVEQLVYKRYRKTQYLVSKNVAFKKQLWTSLRCEDITLSDAEKLEYRPKNLIDYFVKYNRCKGSEFVNFNEQYNKDRDIFRLTIRPGISSSSFTYNNEVNPERSIDFGNNTNFRIGLEAEVFLPFNKNKWSVFVEPTYQSYEVTQDVSFDVNPVLSINTPATANYTSIEIPIGLRHYFYLNNQSSIFVNLGFVILDLTSDSSIDFETIDGGTNIVTGLGFNFNSKFSLELRYGFNRNIVDTLVSNESNFNAISFILGYSFF